MSVDLIAGNRKKKKKFKFVRPTVIHMERKKNQENQLDAIGKLTIDVSVVEDETVEDFKTLVKFFGMNDDQMIVVG